MYQSPHKFHPQFWKKIAAEVEAITAVVVVMVVAVSEVVELVIAGANVMIMS